MNTHTAILASLVVAFPQPAIDARTIVLYAEHLAKYDPADVKDAVDYTIEHAQFFPKLADLRSRICVNVSARLKRESRDRYQLAEHVEGDVHYFRETGNRCEVLQGETWTEADLIDHETGRRGIRNNVFYRAQEAMRALMEERCAANVAARQ